MDLIDEIEALNTLITEVAACYEDMPEEDKIGRLTGCLMTSAQTHIFNIREKFDELIETKKEGDVL